MTWSRGSMRWRPVEQSAVLVGMALSLAACSDRSSFVDDGEGATPTGSQGSGTTEGDGVDSSSGAPPLGTSSTGADSSGGSDHTPPPDGLGPWGFGYVDLPEIVADWVGFADLDGDGLADVFAVTYNENFAPVGTTWLGMGDGSFVEVDTATTAPPGDFMRAADFDGDGDVDIAIFDDYGADHFRVLINEGGGQLGGDLVVPIEGFFGFGVQPIDHDGDAMSDLFLPLGHSEGAAVYVANGGFGFVPGPAVALHGCYGSDSAVGDLDGDGLDEVVTTGSCNAVPGTLPFGVYRREGGEFLLAQTVDGMLGPVIEGCDLELVDADGDGDDDAVTGTTLGLYVVLHDGGGVFLDAPIVIPHTYEGYTQRVVPLRLGPEGSLGFALESYEDADLPAAALVIPEPSLEASATELLDLQGRIAGADDFDGDGRPDLAVLRGDDAQERPLAIWLSGG